MNQEYNHPGSGTLDPVLMAVLSNRLNAIVREMVNTLLKTARSAVLAVVRDFSCSLVTADNRLPNREEARTWEECRRIGTLLADEALRILRDVQPQESPALFCAAKMITLPVESPMMQQLIKIMPAAATHSADSVTTQVNVINLGNAQILTIPGEALPNIGFYLKRKMRGEHNLLFGLTNDAYGYILTKEDFKSFKRYDYISRTSLGERTGEIFVNEALKLVNECPRPVLNSGN